MTEYTPTTEQVRHAYVEWCRKHVPGRIFVRAEFDRWLAAHDAEVRRATTEEGS